MPEYPPIRGTIRYDGCNIMLDPGAQFLRLMAFQNHKE
jgi:hypothetical protein